MTPRVRKACPGRLRRTKFSTGRCFPPSFGASPAPSASRVSSRSKPARWRKTISGFSISPKRTRSLSALWVISNPKRKIFPALLERFTRNHRFKGIRCGNLWDRNLSSQLSDPAFIAGLKLLARANLEMDTANPNPALLAAIVHLTDQVPDLRVVIDHLPIDPPPDSATRAELDKTMRHLADRPQVFVKVSSVLRRVNGRVPQDLDYYRPGLDQLWQLFGADRLMYGSNWPVSNLIAPYPAVLKIVREYFTAKGSAASEKYFWRNATKAYRL